MFAHLTLIGNVAAAPELRQEGSRPHTWFPLEVGDPAGGNGSQVYDVTVQGKQAGACAEQLHVGQLVLVETDQVQANAGIDQDNRPVATVVLTTEHVRVLAEAAGR